MVWAISGVMKIHLMTSDPNQKIAGAIIIASDSKSQKKWDEYIKKWRKESHKFKIRKQACVIGYSLAVSRFLKRTNYFKFQLREASLRLRSLSAQPCLSQ